MQKIAPGIATESLRLRAFTAQDADAYYVAVLGNDETVRALPTGRPSPRQRVDSIIEAINDHWAEFGFGLWAVTLDEALIGHAGLRHLDRKAQIEFTYALAPPHDNVRLPAEAGHAVLNFAFSTLKLQEVIAVVLPEHSRAKRVYNRLGMQLQRRKIHAYDMFLPCYSIYQGDFSY